MLRLLYRSSTTIPVEAECLAPDQLLGKSLADIQALPVQHGNAPAPLGEFFAVEGDAADQHIIIEGDCGRVKLVGASMKSGRITIRGNIGMHLGSEMKGGEIHVHGNATDWWAARCAAGASTSTATPATWRARRTGARRPACAAA